MDSSFMFDPGELGGISGANLYVIMVILCLGFPYDNDIMGNEIIFLINEQNISSGR